MAKHVLQVTDFVQTQVIDHLSNVHLFMEPLCVCMQRQFSKLHPLHQILKYHCLGLLGTNKLGFPFLFAPGNGTLDKLTTVGARGAMRMVQRAYQNFNWGSTDFLVNIKVSKAIQSAKPEQLDWEYQACMVASQYSSSPMGKGNTRLMYRNNNIPKRTNCSKYYLVAR